MSELFCAAQQPATALLQRVWALDPREGVDGPSDILIRDGQIAQIAPAGSLEAPAGAEVRDCEGLHAFPAFVDPHVHLRVPGQEHKEDLQTGTRSAAAGGYCAVVAMPNTTPTVDDPTLLRGLIAQARAHACIPVGFMASITHGLAGERLTDMSELRGAGAMGFTDDGKPVSSAGLLRRALQYQAICGGMIALHEEDPSLSGSGVMREGAVSAVLGLAGIPPISESTMLARDALICEHENARLHFQHLSATSSITALGDAKSRGAQVSGEASPHHLLLTHEAIRENPLDTSLKMNPPLGTEEDRQALICALRDGTVDCVATDHAPHAPDEKNVPFEDAPMGTTGLESAFAALYSGLVLPGILTLSTLVERMTSAAQLLEIPTPRLATDHAANICLVDLGAQWRVGESGYESRSQNCCFAGREFNARVLLTFAAGFVAYRERAFALSAA